MRVKVIYFGMIAEQLERHEEEIDLLVEGNSIDLNDFFRQRYPALSSMSFQIAVNQELRSEVDGTTEINEIALLPPFAGG